MADQKINELPTKTAPSTGDKMLMIGAAEEYQIDYDKLASAILNKLSTQSFSSLDTTSKTVLGAIDELNSKSYLLKYGIEINMNEDLNNLTEPGTYYSKNDATTKSLTNCPLTTLGFTMTVNYSTGNDSSYICQTIYGRLDSFTPIRYVRYKSGSNWGEWYSFSDDATVLSKTGIELYGEQVIDAVPSTEYTTVGQINVKEGNNLIMVYAMFNNSRPIGLKLQTTSGADVAVVESNNLAITLSLFVHANSDVTYNILLKCLFESVSINNVYTSILHFG